MLAFEHPSRHHELMLPYALTIFAGAFLLFQVQPLIGKFILPWFGGGPGVWTVCMLFFQVLLLGGYAYAHWTSRWLKPRTQAILQLALVVVALAWLPIAPGERWKPAPQGNPVVEILVLLTATVGLPYFVLSTTGPLIQQWFHWNHPDRTPYRLFALSNTGSLLALTSYPLVFEPYLTRKAQAAFWGGGLVLYAAVCTVCAIRNLKLAPQLSKDPDPWPRTTPAADNPQPVPVAVQRLFWVLLPAAASVLLLAVTNKLCQDVAAIPFLWVAPLSLYLLSFIICFDSPRWYRRFPFALALVGALAALCWALYTGGNWPLWKQISIYCTALFICCMVCHGEVYRLRPAPQQLTAFYLSVASGGALGGLFVAVAAPLLFSNYCELYWGVWLCAALFLLVCITEQTETEPAATWRRLGYTLPVVAMCGLDWFIAQLARSNKVFPTGYLVAVRVGMWLVFVFLLGSWLIRRKNREFRFWRPLACLWLALGVAALGFVLWSRAGRADPDRVLTRRNFYGVLTVFEHHREDRQTHHFVLQHGRITHGLQFVDEEQATWPTSYYAPESGIGLAFDVLPAASRRLGVVGLGTGSLAVYAEPGDYLRIYEINPQVVTIATSNFHYLARCAAKTEVVLGDARLSLEREPPQQFDLLALDAFSSDSIPVHLLTKEAFEIYDRHLKPNGVIAVHISNHFLDLSPVILNVARQFNYQMASIDFDENLEDWWLYSCTWILLTRDPQLLQSARIRSAATALVPGKKKVPLWTDDFASLWQILR